MKKLKTPMIIIVILGLLYIAVALFFNGHMFPHTFINGASFSLKTEADVQKYFKDKVKGYQLTIKERQSKEVIKGKDIGFKYQKNDEIASIIEKQKNWRWPAHLFKRSDFKTKITVHYNKTKFEEKITSLKCSNEKKWKQPQNAKPEYKDGKFTIIKEVEGTAINKELLNKKVTDSIAKLSPEIDLAKDGCYLKPKFKSEDKEVKKACDDLNHYVKASITYTFGENKEVIDGKMIKDWLTVDKNTMKVAFHDDKVNEAFKAISDRYDTIYQTRTFIGHDGKSYKIPPGTYGWEINNAKEIKVLKESIKKGETITKEPIYIHTAANHTQNDWGDTYAEISISKQHVWYYKGGKVVFDADVVTGSPTKKRKTPVGMHSCLEKKRNKVLRGDRTPGGGYEYETPVSYWMRVTWSGVGFHDATWQPSFGGERYRTSGSHGCINMSMADAKKLYGIIQVGDAVIIHK